MRSDAKVRPDVPPPASHAPHDPEKARLDLDSFVPYRLSVLSNRVSKAIANEYSSRFGLTIPEWRVMAVLGGRPGLSARAVAERTEMDKVQVSRAVARLLRARRIQRTADNEDGRVTRLSLSPRGRAIYDEIAPLALRLERDFLELLSEDERRALDQLMTKLSRHAKTFLNE
jgi:DNA-binding MarR family transcriptional regulator